MTEEASFVWLIGLLEGEGTFLRPSPSRPHSPAIELEMTDEDVIRRAAALVGVRYRVRDRRVGESDTRRVSYHLRVSGKRAVQLMWRIRPYMSARRQVQILRAIDAYVARGVEYHPDNLPTFALKAVCASPMCAAPCVATERYCETHLVALDAPDDVLRTMPLLHVA